MIVTTVSETYLPLEARESPPPSSSNGPKMYPAKQDVLPLSYGSFEKHFLWNTNLFCSQSRPINQTWPSKWDIFNRKKYENVLADDINRNISLSDSNENGSMTQNKHVDVSTSQKNTLYRKLESKCVAYKKNPYSIEEILKKPETKFCRSKTNFFDYQGKEHISNVISGTKSIEFNSENVNCFDHTEELNLINKKSRIRLKTYDISV